MKNTSINQKATVSFLLISIALTLYNAIYIDWQNWPAVVGFLGSLSGIISSVIALFKNNVYTQNFNFKDWKFDQNDSSYYIEISASMHKKGRSPLLKTEIFDGNKFSECSIAAKLDDDGNLEIWANQRFIGRATIS